MHRLAFLSFLVLQRSSFYSSELFLGFNIKQHVSPKAVAGSVQTEQKPSETLPSRGSLLAPRQLLELLQPCQRSQADVTGV